MNLLRNQEPSGGIAFGEVGFIMALWKYGIVALCHYGIVRCQFHNGSFSQMNQLQNLSCVRHWEFRSLGDLESLNDSKTPKLQVAKAMSFTDEEWWLLNAKRLPAQSFVFCPLSFVLPIYLKTSYLKMGKLHLPTVMGF